MKKSLISLIALAFALALGVAQAAKHEAPAAAKDDPIAAACKDKKAGTEVTVDGKKVKCPKKDMKKKSTEAPKADAPKTDAGKK